MSASVKTTFLCVEDVLTAFFGGLLGCVFKVETVNAEDFGEVGYWVGEEEGVGGD